MFKQAMFNVMFIAMFCMSTGLIVTRILIQVNVKCVELW